MLSVGLRGPPTGYSLNQLRGPSNQRRGSDVGAKEAAGATGWSPGVERTKD